MATASNKVHCFKCNKEKIIYKCEGCSNGFCLEHLTQHRQTLTQQLDGIENDRDQIQQSIFQQKQKPENHPLMEQINQWEQNSILKIQQTAEEYRQILIKHLNQHITKMENKFIELTELIRRHRQENEFNEIDLNHVTNKLSLLTQELMQPSNLSIQEDSSSLTFINKISVISSEQIKWKQQGITIAGGFGQGDQLNQLWCPYGIFIDNDKTFYIADSWNHRIVQWIYGENKSQVIGGGNERGNRDDQLNFPTDVIVDKQNNSLIISDRVNRRVMRWSSQNKTNQQILMSDIDCWGLTMDKNEFIYVSDAEKHEVRRWKEGETNGTIVAGGNGKGNHLNQLNYPTFIFVDEDYSVYVSDYDNHRVMKWSKDAKEGIVVAGGNGDENILTQLSNPTGVIVDRLGHIYVADFGNNRVMRWCEGSAEGSVVVGGNGAGEQPNQLNQPTDLSFDVEGNLYVVDHGNHRIQKFLIDFDQN